MTFDEVLAQVLELLQREERVSYRALKLRFDINDEYIEGIKDELIYAKKLAVDEEHRVLVWTGACENTQQGASHPAQLIQQPATRPQPSAQAETLPTAPPPDAERCQLTVVFCDLVDSTKLSGQLDPEEYRDVVRAYQQVCSEVVSHFDGHVAQLLGDGLRIYSWCTEGFDTANLKDAKALLMHFGRSPSSIAGPGVPLDQRTGPQTKLCASPAVASSSTTGTSPLTPVIH